MNYEPKKFQKAVRQGWVGLGSMGHKDRQKESGSLGRKMTQGRDSGFLQITERLPLRKQEQLVRCCTKKQTPIKGFIYH